MMTMTAMTTIWWTMTGRLQTNYSSQQQDWAVPTTGSQPKIVASELVEKKYFG